MKKGLVFGAVAIISGVGGYMMGRTATPSLTTVVSEGAPSTGRALGGLVGGRAGSDSEPSGVGANGEGGSAGISGRHLDKDLEILKRTSNPVERLASLTRMLEGLSPENLPKVLAAFGEIPMRPEHSQEYQMLLYSWAKFDPQAALKFVEENANSRSLNKNTLLGPVISSWASENPEEALAYINGLPEAEQGNQGLLRGLIAGWATKDPYAAADYLQTVPEGKNREALVGEITAHLIKQGPAEATRWAESLSDPSLKEQGFEELAEDWVSLDPVGLANWLGKFAGDDFSAEAFEDLARGWVSTDPESATEWFAKLPDGKAKEQGIYEMARTWGDNDLAGLGEWLNSLPDSKTTDLGVSAYSERLMRESPEAAVQSAMSIVDNELRDRTVMNAAQQWYRQNPEGATAWASQNGITPEQLQPKMPEGFNVNQEQLNEVTRMMQSGTISADQVNQMMRAQMEALQRMRAGQGPADAAPVELQAQEIVVPQTR